MNYSYYLKLFEPIQDQLSGVYSTATLVISILLLLWALNLIIGLITRIFSLGKSIGSFYRSFIHRYVRIIILSLMNLFPNKKTT